MAMQPFVFIDLNTQRDFLDAGGSCPVLQLDRVRAALSRLFALAQGYHLPVISAIDAHREGEAPNGMPRHCLEGTLGAKKVSSTLLRKRTLIEANNNFDLPLDLLSRYRQVLFIRRTRDLFENPKADRLLSTLEPQSFIVFGVSSERSLQQLVLALLARNKPVSIVPEACGYWNETDGEMSLRQLVAKGAVELPLAELEPLLQQHCTRLRPRSLPRKGATRRRALSRK
ncbi:MAG: hypothetical protein HJJLKODD_02371 [Phycisphaerae bacterium]|nr:hypothetical protein [Phycisphaerae bacterium]